MIETFHDEMSTLEEEAVNMQKQFAEGVLVKTQLVRTSSACSIFFDEYIFMQRLIISVISSSEQLVK